MQILQYIKLFKNQYVNREEKIFLTLFVICTILSLTFLMINCFFTKYNGNQYLMPGGIKYLPCFIVITLTGLYASPHYPRIGNIFRGLGITFLSLFTCALTVTSIQYTPFPIIDIKLAAIVNAMQINTPAIINWTFAHPDLSWLLMKSYLFLETEAPAAFFALILLNNKKQFDKYICVILISWIIGTTFYYFYPSVGPASMFHSNHFGHSQYDTITKFNEIHHHLPVTVMDGGMIVFPSFHVIWAGAIIYAFSNLRWWFFSPILIVNTLIIISTVLLGRHYLIDVIGGILVLVIAILMSKVLLNHKLTLKQQCLGFGKWLKGSNKIISF